MKRFLYLIYTTNIGFFLNHIKVVSLPIQDHQFIMQDNPKLAMNTHEYGLTGNQN